MNSISPKKPLRPKRRTDLIVHELDGEALVHDPRSRDTHRLNETALAIWKACTGEAEAKSIAATLAKRYDIAPEDAVDHVEHMFEAFQRRALLEDEPAHRTEEAAHA